MRRHRRAGPGAPHRSEAALAGNSPLVRRQQTLDGEPLPERDAAREVQQGDVLLGGQGKQLWDAAADAAVDLDDPRSVRSDLDLGVEDTGGRFEGLNRPASDLYHVVDHVLGQVGRNEN